MSHSLVYIVPFKSLRNDAFEVHILKENHVGGSPIELVGGGDPLTISFDNEDFLYTPCRQSSCKIKVVGSDYLQDLYSNNYHEWKVNIYRNKTLIWTGFINPETYTQDFTNTTIELQLEAKSALSVLENIEYKSDKRTWITIWDYLKKIIKTSKADYNHIIIPGTYQRDEANIFENLQFSEANFYDEEGEAMMVLETLEELCKFLNWTVTDWNGALTFVDVDFKGEYRQYNHDLTNYTTIKPRTISVQDMGFNGGNNTLDIIPGYTKATIKVSNYNVDEISPDIDYDNLDIIGKRGNTNGSKFNTMWQFLNGKPNGWEIYHYDLQGNIKSNEEYAKAENLLFELGSTYANVFSYESDKGISRPSYNKNSIQYKPVILVRTKSMKYPVLDMQENKVYEIKDKLIARLTNPNELKYTQGAICIKLSVEALTWSDAGRDRNILLATDETNGISGLNAKFRLGKYYWSGTRWVETETTFKLPLNNDSKSGFMQLETNKILFEGPNDADGYILDLWSNNAPKQVMGDFELEIYSSNEYYTRSNIGGYNIADFEVTFVPLSNLSKKDAKGDRIYENAINENLISELDDIEVKISSHNHDGISHSKVLLDGEYLTDNLYSKLADKGIRPEEQFITRIINQYDNAKIKLTQELEFNPILPIDRLTDRFTGGKEFSITGGEYNPAQHQLTLNMIENG